MSSMKSVNVSLTKEDRLQIDVPIMKVDAERRLVHGYATLNNIDNHGDLIDANASRKAFERFRGNIREMHAPVAVGKMVSFDVRTLEDEDSGDTYEGVYVTARVSKGAQDTWEKVMDGTLSGFSIGGNARAFDIIENADGTRGRLVTDYDLVELSLVDSPANPLANLMLIEKLNDEITVSGDSFLDSGEDVVLSKFESLIDKFTEFIEKKTGGNQMSDETKTTDEVVEVEETVEEQEETTEDDTEVTKAADVSEVEDDTAEDAPVQPEVDLTKIIDSVVEKVLERLDASDTTDEVVTEDENLEKADSSNEALEELKSMLASMNESLGTVATRVESLEKNSAIRKSVDVIDNSDESSEEQPFWGAKFTGTYISADSLD